MLLVATLGGAGGTGARITATRIGLAIPLGAALSVAGTIFGSRVSTAFLGVVTASLGTVPARLVVARAVVVTAFSALRLVVLRRSQGFVACSQAADESYIGVCH